MNRMHSWMLLPHSLVSSLLSSQWVWPSHCNSRGIHRLLLWHVNSLCSSQTTIGLLIVKRYDDHILSHKFIQYVWTDNILIQAFLQNNTLKLLPPQIQGLDLLSKIQDGHQNGVQRTVYDDILRREHFICTLQILRIPEIHYFLCKCLRFIRKLMSFASGGCNGSR